MLKRVVTTVKLPDSGRHLAVPKGVCKTEISRSVTLSCIHAYCSSRV